MSFKNVMFVVFTAVWMSACAASTVNEPAMNELPRKSLVPQPDIQQARGDATASDALDDKEAVRKVALNLAAVSDPESKSYKVGPRDVLEITVFQAPELSKTIQVSEAGTLNFPLIGEVYASGKTAREIEQELRNKLGAKYLQNPQVSVFVKDYFSQRITLEGAVKKPGVYPIAGGMSLLQALAEAQGFDDNASHTVVLFRNVNGRRMTAQYDVASIRDGSAEDIPLQAGDVIIIPTSDLKAGMNLLLKFAPLATLAAL